MAERTLTDCERELRELQEHYARLLDEAGAPREDGTMAEAQVGNARAVLGVNPTEDRMPRVVGFTDPLEKHPGLVWREKEIVGDVVQTMRGPMPTMTVERKPDLNMEALAACAARDPRVAALVDTRKLGADERKAFSEFVRSGGDGETAGYYSTRPVNVRTLCWFGGGWHERREDGTWAKVTVSRGHDNDPDETIRQAGEATRSERKAKNTFAYALRNLVLGIDVQGEDGTWSVDREALMHARRVLGIEREEE